MKTLEELYAGRGANNALEAFDAYAFARQHDWGRFAALRQDDAGDWHLTKLVDAYTLNGSYHEEQVELPATMRVIRRFGGY